MHACRRRRPGSPPPPQVWGAVQVPQSRVPPQPSAAGPQVKPSWAQVRGVQVCGGGTSASTHEARSKIMNSSSFSCGVIGRGGALVGKVEPGRCVDDVEVAEEHAAALLRGGAWWGC